MFRNILPLSVLCFLLMSAALGQQTLVEDGKTTTLVQVANKTPQGILDAADDLIAYFGKISGARPRRTDMPACYARIQDPDHCEIVVMTAEQARFLLDESMKQKLANVDPTFAQDAFYIKTVGKKLFIVGNSVLGTRNGVYAFLEKYLGVRWFYPGDLGESYIKQKTITVPEIDDFQVPDYFRRELSCASVFTGEWTFDEVKSWNYRNRLHMGDWRYTSARDGGHLTFEHAVPQSLFGEHPEYFPLIDGKRVPKNDFGPVQRCVSNPEVFRRTVEYLCEFYSYAPDGVFSMGAWDGENLWCTCDACRKMADDHGEYSIPRLYYDFSSRVMTEVRKKFPNAAMSFYIYSQYRDPFQPEWEIAYPAGVEGIYCPHGKCEMHAFDDPNCFRNRKFFAWLEEWRKLLPEMKISVFDYLVCANNPYAPLEYVAGPNLRILHENGVTGYIDHQNNSSPEKDVPAPGLWNSNWQLTYVNSKMLWDCGQDTEQILNEAYDRYYGPAAAAMKAYHAYRRELWENAPTEHIGYPHSPRRIAECLLVPGALERLTGYLDRAVVDVRESSDPEKAKIHARILLDRKFLKDYWVESYKTIEQAARENRLMPVCERTGEITLDGRLDEPTWKKAAVVDAFSQTNGAAPTEATRVRVLYDKENWYVGIEALTAHAHAPLRADAKSRDDGNISQDDELEIFIAPPDAEYFHWMINTKGQFYDARGMDKSYDSAIEFRVETLPDRYVLEARIPVSSLNASLAPGQVWQFHFGRMVSNLMPPASREFCALDGIHPHDQPFFRRAVLGESILQNGDFSIQDPKTETPKFWGYSKDGKQVTDTDSGAVVHRIHLHPGALYQYFRRDPGKMSEPYRVQGRVRASGTGTFRVWVRTNRGQLSLPEKQRDLSRYADSRDLQTFELTDTPAEYTFQFELQPYEQGYFYVSGLDTRVEHVFAVRE